MLRLVVIGCSVVFLSACGVDTSSSAQQDTVVAKGTNQPPLGLIDPNPVQDSNSSTSGGGSGGGTSGGDGGDQSNSIFDVTGAVYDKYACIKGDVNDGYTNNSIADTSIDDRGVEDVEDGLLINSKYPLNQSDAATTKVTLFYYDLTVARDMSMVNIYEDFYKLSIDRGWGYNGKNTMYVMTPKGQNGLFSCYRYNVNDIVDGTYIKTKVYRNKV